MGFDSENWLANRQTLVEERNHPNHWLNRAKDLRASAGALWHAMGPQDAMIAKELGYYSGHSMSVACWPVYHMLCGLSLELIMKAVLIQRNTPTKKIEIHFLHKLHLLLELELNSERKLLLDFYESSVVWAGRYPIPRNPTKEKLLDFYDLQSEVLTKPKPMQSTGTLKFRVSSDTTDWINYSRLWSEYECLYT